VNRFLQGPPGILWPLGVGGVAFAAGFFGPMVLVPESNLGPIIGLVSGPAGLIVGAVLGLLCRLTGVPERAQWVGLAATCVGAVLTLSILVKPEPATRGYLVELQVVRQRPLHTQTDVVIAHWRDYVARVTWTQPRPGWEEQMRRDLQTAPGSVLDVLVLRKKEIKEDRSVWRRGQRIETPWVTGNEPASYYLPPGQGGALAPGSKAIHFLAYDSLAAVEPPSEWPPREVGAFLNLSVLAPVPDAYRTN